MTILKFERDGCPCGGSQKQQESRGLVDEQNYLSLKQQLSSLGYAATHESENVLFVEVLTLDGTVQRVYIQVVTETLPQFSLRSISATGFIRKGHVSRYVLYFLMERNRTIRPGAWDVVKQEDFRVGTFAAHIAVDASAQVLRALIEHVALEIAIVKQTLADDEGS